MQKHELKVLHKMTQRVIVISKKRYLINPLQYEVLEGDAPNALDEILPPPPPAPKPAVKSKAVAKKSSAARKSTAKNKSA